MYRVQSDVHLACIVVSLFCLYFSRPDIWGSGNAWHCPFKLHGLYGEETPGTLIIIVTCAAG